MRLSSTGIVELGFRMGLDLEEVAGRVGRVLGAKPSKLSSYTKHYEHPSLRPPAEVFPLGISAEGAKGDLGSS